MADEDGVLQVQLSADLDHVIGIAGQARIFGPVVGAKVRAAGADVVEQDSAEILFERGRHESPHVLVATEAMGEHHRPLASAARCARCFARLLPAFGIPLFLATCLFLAGISSPLRVLMPGMGAKACCSRGGALRNDCWTPPVSRASSAASVARQARTAG